MNVNVRDVNDTISSLVRQRVPVVDADLADPEVPLERLAHVVDGAA